MTVEEYKKLAEPLKADLQRRRAEMADAKTPLEFREAKIRAETILDCLNAILTVAEKLTA